MESDVDLSMYAIQTSDENLAGFVHREKFGMKLEIELTSL